MKTACKHYRILYCADCHVEQLKNKAEEMQKENEDWKKLHEITKQSLNTWEKRTFDQLKRVEEMQKTLDEWENAALIPCNTCGGGGFNGQGTGYNNVCDGCAGNGGYMGRATPQDLIEMIAKRMQKGETQ